MKNVCLHCNSRPQVPGEMLCEKCLAYPKCEGCQVIFGEGFSRPSRTNPNRCDSCLYLEDNVGFFCEIDGKRLPLFYSPNTNTLHFIVRGNFCGHCNNACAIQARVSTPREEAREYIGYLALLADEVTKGRVSIGAFEEAKEMNPHDIIRIQPNKTEL